MHAASWCRSLRAIIHVRSLLTALGFSEWRVRGDDTENAINRHSYDPWVYRQVQSASKGGRAMTERKTFVRIRNLDDLQAVIDRHVAEVHLANPADTPAALEAVGF